MSISNAKLGLTIEYYSRFSHIFYLDASSKISIKLGLMQIAQAINTLQGAKQSAESALQWISQRTNWLMIYDGADGHYQIVEKFLPPRNRGNILITSRNVGLKRISLVLLKVANMAEEDAALLIMKSAALDHMPDHMNLVRKLALELGGIPLALDQAGAHMLASQCGISDYLDLYTKHKHELMSNPEFKGASDYDKTTCGAWDISMQKIEKMAEKDTGEDALAAQSAIKIFAFLDHVNIPLELFKNAAENYMERAIQKDAKSQFLLSIKNYTKRVVKRDAKSNFPLSIRLLDHQTLFLNEEGVWEKMRFLAGIQMLISFSLIEAHSHLYSMHLLVHAWSRNWVPKAEIKNLYHKARALLACSVTLDYTIDNYTFCQLLAPHIRSNGFHASQLELEGTYDDDEYDWFSLVFHHVARKAKLGSEHPDTLANISNLASTYMSQGRWDEAEKLVMNGTKTKLGSDHHITLTSMGNLAYIYRHQGRWDEAEKLEVDVMNTRKAKFGLEHPDTLVSIGNLACIYRNQGRWDDAEKLGIAVMNARKSTHGSDHPDTLTSIVNLASTYGHQGRWDEAEKLQVDVMNQIKAKLGSDHPDTLASMGYLASTYRHQGRWDEAEQLQVDVLRNKSKAWIRPP